MLSPAQDRPVADRATVCLCARSAPFARETFTGTRCPNHSTLAALIDTLEPHFGDARALLTLSKPVEEAVGLPGQGNTRTLWETLATIAMYDVGASRIFEPHLDARAIRAQAGLAVAAEGTWGVYAAEAPHARLTAQPATHSSRGEGEEVEGEEWELQGAKAWCSLASTLDHALVSAFINDTDRALFAVDLKAPGVTASQDGWEAHGMAEVPSVGVTFDRTSATMVGEPGWYLNRPGFAWGGMQVAAAWFGGALGLVREFDASLTRREPDQIALATLGRLCREVSACAAQFAVLADLIDAAEEGIATRSGDYQDGQPEWWPAALALRGNVAASAESTLHTVLRGMGPAPLALNAAFAKRVADLTLYLRQHHFDRDDASLGALMRKGEKS